MLLYVFKNYKGETVKKILLLLTAACVLMYAQNSKPFLITGKMPHVTKSIKQNWNNKELALTDAQKERLLKVRSETMGAVMKLTKEITLLEDEVAKATILGAKPESLKAKVEQISKLKARATIVHINCIYNTKNILDEKQFEMLLGM